MSVTVVQAGPCSVVRKKTKESDGYDALCIGFEPVKKDAKKDTKKEKKASFRYLKEFKPQKLDTFEVGKDVTVSIFKKGDIVDVSGITKGKGFQGVIKRCKKKGGPAAHGSKFHRTTGSVGMRTWPGRVLPGTGMAGHMGAAKRTIKNLQVFGLDDGKNLLFIKGAIPGAKNSLVVVSSKTL